MEKGTIWSLLNDTSTWCMQLVPRYLQKYICYFGTPISLWMEPQQNSLSRAFLSAWSICSPCLYWGFVQPILNIDCGFNNICFLKKLQRKLVLLFSEHQMSFKFLHWQKELVPNLSHTLHKQFNFIVWGVPTSVYFSHFLYFFVILLTLLAYSAMVHWVGRSFEQAYFWGLQLATFFQTTWTNSRNSHSETSEHSFNAYLVYHFW